MKISFLIVTKSYIYQKVFLFGAQTGYNITNTGRNNFASKAFQVEVTTIFSKKKTFNYIFHTLQVPILRDASQFQQNENVSFFCASNCIVITLR